MSKRRGPISFLSDLLREHRGPIGLAAYILREHRGRLVIAILFFVSVFALLSGPVGETLRARILLR